MLTSEWLEISAIIRDRWPSANLPPETLQRWGADLEDVPTQHVAAALEALYREGREFPPNAGQIRAKVADLEVAPPEWGWVLSEISRIARRSTKAFRPQAVGEGDVEDLFVDERAEALEAAHPLIRGFVKSVGWTQISIEQGSDEARLREKWLAFVKRARREVLLAGIPSGGLRELRRIEGGKARQLGDVAREVVAEIGSGQAA